MSTKSKSKSSKSSSKSSSTKKHSSKSVKAESTEKKSSVSKETVAKAAKTILAVITQKPKHYTKLRLREKFAKTYTVAGVQKGIKSLRSDKRIVKTGNVFTLPSKKKAA